MNKKDFRKGTARFLFGCFCVALFGGLLTANWETFSAGILLLCLSGALFVLAIDYLLAKEFELVAEEKGHYDRAYFWYTFIFGVFGMLLVIALPNIKEGSEQEVSDDLPEL